MAPVAMLAVGSGQEVGVRTCLRSLLLFVVVLVLGVPAPAHAASTPSTPSTPATGAPIRVAVRPSAPFVIVGKNGDLSGFSVDLTRAVAAEQGVQVEFVVVGTVAEQLDALQQGRADAAVGALAITAQREDVVDFSQPMFDTGIQIGVPERGSAFSLSDLLSQIFTRTLLIILIAMAIGTLLTGTLIWAIERRHDNPDFTAPGIRGVFDGIWWSTVTLFTIGYGDKVPRRVSSRLVTMAWMFSGVLLVATLTAEVTAGLTVERIDSQINTVSDLAGKRVVTVDGTTSSRFLEQRGINSEALADADVAFDRVRTGKADAVVYDGALLQYLIARHGGVKLAGPIVQPEHYGIAFPLGSPLRQSVNRALLEARERGTYNRIYNDYFG